MSLVRLNTAWSYEWTRGVLLPALERDGNTLKQFDDVRMNPRPDAVLGLLKCSEAALARAVQLH